MSKSRLQLTVLNTADWEQVHDREGVLFCPMDAPLEIGRVVTLEICFNDGPLFLVHGRVVWRRPHTDRRMYAGVGIAVDERHLNTLEYINGWAAGTLTDRRRFPRLPLRLRVAYGTRGRRRINFTRDLAQDSVYINSSQLLAVNDQIDLNLAPPDQPAIPLIGRVARCGDQSEPQGMGIQLVFPNEATALHFARFIQELRMKLHRGEIPPEMLT